ncbi:serine hydrolase domain-containing protein [Streptomyces lasalocidi]
MVGLAAVAIAATAFTGPARAAARDTAPMTADHQATRAAIDAAVKAGVPGITAEVRDADGTWKYAAGVGDTKTGAPRGENDRFRISSNTDTFVATVLLQMEAEKKLSLDDTVEHYLPGVVTGNGNDGSAITVRQLLNHTSGLYDYLGDKQYVDTYVQGDGFLQHRYDTVTPGQRLKAAFSHAPMFKPGTEHWFSHTNDVLAAMIVEKVGGRSYEDEVRRRIIEPLGLKATSSPGTSTGLPRPSSRAYGKLFGGQPDRIDDVTEVNGSQNWGDGDIISSADNLNRFYGALLRGNLLPPQQLAEMKTTVDDPAFPGATYGLDIGQLTLGCGTTLWYRDGGMIGWITLTAATEDGRHILTFNYNSDWGAETMISVLNAEYCDTSAVAH